MFRFKHFSVSDDLSSMKVGTDAVLLGCLAHCPDGGPVLDIGTGCGVIALILAQRFPAAQIHAIDIDAASVAQASQNFAQSPWNGRLQAQCTSLQSFSPTLSGQYQLIVSNPPFFVNSLKCPDPKRTAARHTDTLSFADLAQSAARLLSPDGLFYAILPCLEMEQLISNCEQSNLHCIQQIIIKNRPQSAPKRTIAAFSKQPTVALISEEHSIRNADNTYSDWYKSTTKDFYLDF